MGEASPDWLEMSYGAFQELYRPSGNPSSRNLHRLMIRGLGLTVLQFPKDETRRVKLLVSNLSLPLPSQLRFYLYRVTQHPLIDKKAPLGSRWRPKFPRIVMRVSETHSEPQLRRRARRPAPVVIRVKWRFREPVALRFLEGYDLAAVSVVLETMNRGTRVRLGPVAVVVSQPKSRARGSLRGLRYSMDRSGRAGIALRRRRPFDPTQWCPSSSVSR